MGNAFNVIERRGVGRPWSPMVKSHSFTEQSLDQEMNRTRGTVEVEEAEARSVSRKAVPKQEDSCACSLATH